MNCKVRFVHPGRDCGPLAAASASRSGFRPPRRTVESTGLQKPETRWGARQELCTTFSSQVESLARVSQNAFRMRTSEKCACKSSAIRTYKITGLKHFWNEHLQKTPEGLLLLAPLPPCLRGCRLPHSKATPSRCGRACGTGWPRSDGGVRYWRKRQGPRLFDPLSGCDRGRARKVPAA